MRKTVYCIGLAASLLLTGCGATLTPQTYSTMTSTIFFKEIKNEKSVYLLSKNSSTADTTIGEQVKQKLLTKGYKVIDEPEKATYVLQINTLNFNSATSNNAATAAVVSGASAAILTGAVTSSMKDAGLAGLGVGLVGGLVAYAVADGHVRMQTDVKITERTKEGAIDYETRVLSEMTAMKLTPEKAQPILEDKTSTQIAGIF
jgi:hypothetical protein